MSKCLSYAAALAAMGWYLMSPPGLCQFNTCNLDRNAPLSEWDDSKSFDTAEQCNAELRKENNDEDKAMREIASDSKCIASDDPRLAK